MEEGREYAGGSPFCNPVGPTVVPVVVARLCEAKSTCLAAAYGPRLEDGHCGEAIREGNMGKFYRAADHHVGPCLLP